MPVIKVEDIAYVRLRAPDLDQAEGFLTDFGLTQSARTDSALYMRGTDPYHHAHITELGGEPGFVGFALKASSEGDLKTFSEVDGASAIEDIGEPGGGKRVRITDPNGLQIEVVHGIETPTPLPIDNKYDWNFGTDHRRQGDILRLKRNACPVKRLGHIVFSVTDFAACDEFYSHHFGLLHSDEMYEDDNSKTETAFMRCDRGDVYVDHHTVLLVPGPECAFNHAAFEVEDLNAVFVGHDYLKSKDYEPHWGVGRHVLGSQIFDYWKNPWGQVHEHWTDGDLLNASTPTGRTHRSEALDIQWGQPAPFRPGN